MSISLTFTDLTPPQVVALLQAAGPGASVTQGAGSATQGAPPPPPPPPPQTAAAPPPPPPPPPPPAQEANPMLTQAMTAMEAYAKIHKATGAKKVLTHGGIDKLTTATPAQLEWAIAAFANTAWTP